MSKARPLTERFWEKVQKSEECWVWVGAKDASGYGQIGTARDTHQAHRVSWTLHNGPIPKGACVLHRCDNPPCVRPDHLFLGTKSDNTRDAVKKGRQFQLNRGKTHCIRGHEFTPENTRIVAKGRVCITCGKDYYWRVTKPRRDADSKTSVRPASSQAEREEEALSRCPACGVEEGQHHKPRCREIGGFA